MAKVDNDPKIILRQFKTLQKKKIQMRQDYIDDAQALCRIIPFPNLTHMLFPFHYEMVKQ